MDLEVVLVVAAHRLGSNQGVPGFLVVEEDGLRMLPARTLYCWETCVTAATDLLKEWTGIDACVWPAATPVQRLLFDNPRRDPDRRVLAVSYSVIIPETTPVGSKAKWMSLPDLIKSGMTGDCLDILTKTAMRL